MPKTKAKAAVRPATRQRQHRGTRRVTAHRHAIRRDFEAQQRGERNGAPSVYSCPDCGGTLWEFEDEFGCHTGHRYSPDRLLHCQTEELEDALFVAIRLLTEKAALLRQVANKTQRTGGAARVLRHQADVDERHAGLIRAHLLQADPGPLADPDASEAAMAAIVAEMRRPMDD